MIGQNLEERSTLVANLTFEIFFFLILPNLLPIWTFGLLAKREVMIEPNNLYIDLITLNFTHLILHIQKLKFLSGVS